MTVENVLSLVAVGTLAAIGKLWLVVYNEFNECKSDRKRLQNRVSMLEDAVDELRMQVGPPPRIGGPPRKGE